MHTNKLHLRFFIPLIMLLNALAGSAFAVTLYDQVLACKSGLQVSRLTPAGSCFGSNTKSVPATRERLGYFRLNDDTDAVFHCGDVDEANRRLTSTSDIEMIIHNRRSGATCFFFHEPDGHPDPNFPSLDSCNNANCSATSFWRRADSSIGGVAENCVFCHQNGGPYFIRESVDAMAHFGLINNGHSTDNTIYHAINADPAKETTENNTIINSRNQGGAECGLSCHRLGIPARITGFNPNPVNFRLDQIEGMIREGSMPPANSRSPYYWVNRDTPNASGDWETYSGVKNEYPDLADCDTPSYMEAHVVGSDKILSTSNRYFGKLRAFNAVEGLVCVNSSNNPCVNYQARFKCSNGNWTGWQDSDGPSGEGDTERPPSSCNATEIEGRAMLNEMQVLAYGMPDRLYQFDNKGLVCKNNQQPDGKCANYVVRFVCP